MLGLGLGGQSWQTNVEHDTISTTTHHIILSERVAEQMIGLGLLERGDVNQHGGWRFKYRLTDEGIVAAKGLTRDDRRRIRIEDIKALIVELTELVFELGRQDGCDGGVFGETKRDEL